MYAYRSFSDFPRVTTGLLNPLLVEEGDTAAMLCEVLPIVIYSNKAVAI